MGTLDIYGFECLETNSLEQLCINLANERLQQFFVEMVLDTEQKLYEREGVGFVPFDLPNWEHVVNSIDLVARILDDHSKVACKRARHFEAKDASDEKFCEQVHRDLKRHVSKLKFGRNGEGPRLYDGFIITHYAGDVSYLTRGWVEKNTETLVPEVEALLQRSTKPLVQDLSKVGGSGGERFESMTNKYINSLKELLATLSDRSAHYIRCFNPNKNKSPAIFDGAHMLKQIIDFGTVQLVNIMHDGYPHRCMLRDVRERFNNLLPPQFRDFSDRKFTTVVLQAFETLEEGQWTMGKTQVFFRAGQLRVLEQLREEGCVASPEVVRRILVKLLLKRWRVCVKVLMYQLKRVRERRRHCVWKMFLTTINIMKFLYRLKRPLRSRPKPNVEVFVALNLYEEVDYLAYMQGDVHAQNKIHDNILAKWQKQTSESILLYDGKHLVSVKMDPARFLTEDSKEKTNAQDRTSLTDLRAIDLYQSGLGLDISEQYRCGISSCMCQHGTLSQIFASCDTDNCIVIWKWMGTHQDRDKPAVKFLNAFVVSRYTPIRRMCFLSKPPARLVEKDGQLLALLVGVSAQKLSKIIIVSVFQWSSFHVECSILLDCQFLQASFFTSSDSGRALVLGGSDVDGNGFLHFYSIDYGSTQTDASLFLEPNETEKLSIEMILNSEGYDFMDASPVSCLCLPPPKKARGIDWITIGFNSGQTYGFFLGESEGRQHVKVKDQGRILSGGQGKWTSRRLIGLYGDEACSHHKAIQATGLSYSLFLETVGHMCDAYCSLDEDGELCAWKFYDVGGWNASPIRNDLGGAATASRFVAGTASRLAPHVVIVVDEAKKRILCFERSRSTASNSLQAPEICYIHC